jgi:hypothetical protein
MANWTNLKNTITELIKENNNQEITGLVLQSVLLNIVANLESHPMFAGVAKPSTTPGIPECPVFYLAAAPGVYSNFEGHKIVDEAVFFVWDNLSWEVIPTGIKYPEQMANMVGFTPSDSSIFSESCEDVHDALHELSDRIIKNTPIVMSESEFNSLETKDENRIYFVYEED